MYNSMIMADKNEAWMADPLPGLDRLHIGIAEFVEQQTAEAQAINRQSGTVTSLRLLQDQAWERYVAGTIRPRELVWQRAVDTLGKSAVSELKIDRNNYGQPLAELRGHLRIVPRSVEAHWYWHR